MKPKLGLIGVGAIIVVVLVGVVYFARKSTNPSKQSTLLAEDPVQFLKIEFRFAQVCADQGGQMAHITNSDPRLIQADIEQTVFREPQHEILERRQMNLHPLVSRGAEPPPALDCTKRTDLSDINNPKFFSFEYRPSGGKFFETGGPPPGGGSDCPSRRSAILNCASSESDRPIADGRYRIRLGVNFQRPLCIDENTSGNFFQLDCRNTEAQHFFLKRDQQGCYTLTAESNGELLGIQQDEGTLSDLLGLREQDISPRNCPYRIDKFRWKLTREGTQPNQYRLTNKATGLCLDADGNEIRPRGRLQGLDCRDIPRGNQRFSIEPQ